LVRKEPISFAGDIMQISQVPSWVPEKSRKIVLKIAEALRELGYSDGPMLWDAARRMAITPTLTEDMFAYIAAGKPKVKAGRPSPPMLSRRLPGNYTVASLMLDLGLSPAGAFLLGAELINNTQAALSLIEKIIEEGYWTILPDGKWALVYPPISEKYPSCPNCGRRWTKNYESCPTCGYNEKYRQIDIGQLPENVKEMIKAELLEDVGKVKDVHERCQSCGAPIEATDRFCRNCGAAVMQPTQKRPAPEYCKVCGAKLLKDAKFCGKCGAPVS